MSKTEDELPLCARLYSGTAIVEIRYPQEFIFTSTNGLYSRKNNEMILDIDTGFFQSVEEIISAAEHDLHLSYAASEFNGHRSAFFKYEMTEQDKNTIWSYHYIPFGNRVIEISYTTSKLDEKERNSAEKVINDITMSANNIDVPYLEQFTC